jgi:hypothetical protein
VALLGLSIGVKLWMGWFYAAMGRRAQSPTLAAAAADARSDVLATSAVLAGLAASHFFHVQLDGWLDGGQRHENLSKVKLEGEQGGKKSFNALAEPGVRAVPGCSHAVYLPFL